VSAEAIKSSGHVTPLIWSGSATASTAAVCQRSAARDPIVSRVTPPGGTGSTPAAGTGAGFSRKGCSQGTASFWRGAGCLAAIGIRFLLQWAATLVFTCEITGNFLVFDANGLRSDRRFVRNGALADVSDDFHVDCRNGHHSFRAQSRRRRLKLFQIWLPPRHSGGTPRRPGHKLLAADRSRENRRDMGQVVFAHIVRNGLVIPHQLACADIQRHD
jgi:hypothetical protein